MNWITLWITLLYTWKFTQLINQLYFNKNKNYQALQYKSSRESGENLRWYLGPEGMWCQKERGHQMDGALRTPAGWTLPEASPGMWHNHSGFVCVFRVKKKISSNALGGLNSCDLDTWKRREGGRWVWRAEEGYLGPQINLCQFVISWLCFEPAWVELVSGLWDLGSAFEYLMRNSLMRKGTLTKQDWI